MNTPVQVVDGVDDAGHVEARGEVVEPAAVAQDRPQLPAQARFHQQIHVPARGQVHDVNVCFNQEGALSFSNGLEITHLLSVSEGAEELGDELVGAAQHDALLAEDVLLLLRLHDVL